MADASVMSLRLEPEDRDQLLLVANIDGMTLSDAIRAAIRRHVAERRADPAFQQATATYLDRQRRLILGDPEDD